MVLHVDDPTVATATTGELATRPGCLCRFDDGSVFAYRDRHNEFVRSSDHMHWATERDHYLVSARSGLPLAYRRGRVFFAVDTDEPILYERVV